MHGWPRKRVLLFILIIIAIYMAAEQANTAPLNLYFLKYPLCRTSE